MKISVLPSVDELHSNILLHKTVVIIDVFRASSSIVTAFSTGAKWVRPAETVTAAREFSQTGALTGGERYGKTLEGFDLGNSPSEYTSDRVRGKGIIMTTTNGTRSLLKATKAEEILIGCFLNATACAHAIFNLHRDTLFLCAGTRGQFSLEDGIAAGKMIHQLHQMSPSIQYDDLSYALLHSWLSSKHQLREVLSQSQSGRRLISRGLEQDVLDCLQVDRYPLVPRWQSDRIILPSSNHD
ncbi:2-phosphosulfolactate phosphatase [Marininema halotolerans]|uniref:Probable 2-phosphosulfolactate phosphatase n=1 Tax=Marininema halotolerans TaxID=1155944 RepID=A0A1I6QQG4_9BACL|nr:2-phosphosulfolactate phosphatase [Marininema halotolerans]SFS54716.1 2-phosphosulfolactate phosphatase [Marininema halotolerans]